MSALLSTMAQFTIQERYSQVQQELRFIRDSPIGEETVLLPVEIYELVVLKKEERGWKEVPLGAVLGYVGDMM